MTLIITPTPKRVNIIMASTSKENEGLTLDNIPDECLQKVFEFIPSGDLTNASKVSKKFKEKIEDPFLWWNKLTKEFIDVPFDPKEDYRKRYNDLLELVEGFGDRSPNELILDIKCLANLDCVRYLAEKKGADIIETRDSERNTPMLLASSKGYYWTVDYLLSNGVHVNQINCHGQNPLHLATMNGSVETVKVIYKHYQQYLEESKKPFRNKRKN